MTLIIAIIVILCIISFVSKVGAFFTSLFTLSFLPNGLNFLYNTNPDTVAIPLIGGILNYISILICNIVDCLIWFIHWIPGLNILIDKIATCPDMDQNMAVMHRNFFTHSVINPTFLCFAVVAILIILITSRFTGVNAGIRLLFFLIGLTFTCHLLADTMPNKWMGTSYIYLFSFALKPPFLSVLWLYINAFISFCVSTSFLTIGDGGISKES